MYFGTREHMTDVRCPAINVVRNREKWTTSGTYLNGGGFSRASAYSHATYSIGWNLMPPDEARKILDFYNGNYGQGPIYFLDDFALQGNVLPLHWSVPRLTAKDAPPLVKGISVSETPLAPVNNAGGYPSSSATFSWSGPANSDSVWIPVPPGKNLYFGARGTRSGDAAIELTADRFAEGSVTSSNKFPNPSFEAGATYPKLSAWTSALATGKAQVVAFGDSITEGVGATNAALRWQTLIQGALRGSGSGATFPFIPAYTTVSTLPVVRSGTVTTNASWGLGWRTATISDATGSLTFTFQGTSCKVMYSSNAATAVMEVSIDGGSPVLVDTVGTSQASVWSSPVLSSGTHTVVVRRSTTSVAGRTLQIQGLLTYNGDETTGIRVLDASKAGYSSANFGSAFVTNASLALAQAGGADLAIIAMGTNDHTAGTTAADFRANIERLISTLRSTAAFTGSVLLVNMYKAMGRNEAQYAVYGEQMAAIAASDPSVDYLNLRDFMPDIPTPFNAPSGLGFFSDSLHPSDAGYARIASVVLNRISTSVTSVSGGTQTSEWAARGSKSLRVESGQTASATVTGPSVSVVARNPGQTATIGGVSVTSSVPGETLALTGTGTLSLGAGWWDALMDGAGTYFDGSMTNTTQWLYSWFDEPNASVSYRTPNKTWRTTTLLPTNTTQRTNIEMVDPGGVTLRIVGSGSMTLNSMYASIGTEPPPNGNFKSGEGHTGVEFDGVPQRTGYSAVIGEGLESVSSAFKEVGAWR